MNRRGFLSSIIAAAAAPSIVRASSLMPGKVWTPPTFKVVERLGAGYVDPFGLAPVKNEGGRIWYDKDVIDGYIVFSNFRVAQS